jgi:DnaJ-class molecular chaperone
VAKYETCQECKGRRYVAGSPCLGCNGQGAVKAPDQRGEGDHKSDQDRKRKRRRLW